MKKTDKIAFVDFMQDEATKYRVSLSRPEIELWFETFEKVSLEEFRSAWVQHKRDEKLGGMFPKIPWMQRALHATGETAGKHDARCLWNGNGQRCKYPVGFFELGRAEGYCVFHRSVISGPGAQAICDDSQGASPAEYLDRARQHIYGDSMPKSVRELQERTAKRFAGGNVGILSTRLFGRAEPAGVRERTEVDTAISAADEARLRAINGELAMASQGGAE